MCVCARPQRSGPHADFDQTSTQKVLDRAPAEVHEGQLPQSVSRAFQRQDCVA